jgi:hypothetical protein
MADHNDPNAVNCIFSDIDVSAADVYDMFGYPSDDLSHGEKVVIALTFASTPDTDLLYRLRLGPHPRPALLAGEDRNLDTLLDVRVPETRPTFVTCRFAADRGPA